MHEVDFRIRLALVKRTCKRDGPKGFEYERENNIVAMQSIIPTDILVWNFMICLALYALRDCW